MEGADPLILPSIGLGGIGFHEVGNQARGDVVNPAMYAGDTASGGPLHPQHRQHGKVFYLQPDVFLHQQAEKNPHQSVEPYPVFETVPTSSAWPSLPLIINQSPI